MVAAGLGENDARRPPDHRVLETVTLLLELGSDAAAATPSGQTALHGAASMWEDEVIQLLVDHGADPQITTVEGTTPLAVAAGIGYNEGTRQAPDEQVLEAIRLAIASGNDPNLSNKHGQTPLHGAVYRGLEPAIQLLVDEGASMDAVDAVGRTPLKLAEEGYFLLASRLRRDEVAVLLARLGNDTTEAARLRRLNPTPGSGATRGTAASR